MSCQEEMLEYFNGNHLPAIPCTYKQKDPNNPSQKIPIDITGYQFRLVINYDIPRIINGSIVNAAEGEFIFEFITGDIHTVGIFNSQITIVDNSSKEITYEFVKFDIKPRYA